MARNIKRAISSMLNGPLHHQNLPEIYHNNRFRARYKPSKSKPRVDFKQTNVHNIVTQTAIWMDTWGQTLGAATVPVLLRAIEWIRVWSKLEGTPSGLIVSVSAFPNHALTTVIWNDHKQLIKLTMNKLGHCITKILLDRRRPKYSVLYYLRTSLTAPQHKLIKY